MVLRILKLWIIMTAVLRFLVLIHVLNAYLFDGNNIIVWNGVNYVYDSFHFVTTQLGICFYWCSIHVGVAMNAALN